ncbi:2-oxo-4-hydroxy-4-carboxy-5-ureidoimidazoline decarboxylase [Marinomonas ostreistagni]|uniref:2-oxo-4-hydroxy-4-carboxy-5-ureidoimidazoline decarboxylase n=1 Tax=Marinomonas ostreistagni TaxID=359209 RepID=UPI001951722E|nr:2-oxo-4-hydroxy-4-carboxy-5-ureidoimidazoline decarboxylase [Marinomonas ostreistagni]MBM6550810.1 2-oxo-4-hydroxy-4-carboxy-5-ureidoimidazoline decarboxylase [Marinomonas ostreistagni]
MDTTETALLDQDKPSFIKQLKDIYEHSKWVAEALYEQRDTLNQHPEGIQIAVQSALRDIVEAADHNTQLALLRAHPDLAGKAALAGELTDASSNEQAGAGLDQLSPPELERFLALNESYRDKFGFPFIMAVKGASKDQILEAFEARLPNTVATEFRYALNEVHKIAGFRLAALPDSLWAQPSC